MYKIIREKKSRTSLTQHDLLFNEQAYTEWRSLVRIDKKIKNKMKYRKFHNLDAVEPIMNTHSLNFYHKS